MKPLLLAKVISGFVVGRLVGTYRAFSLISTVFRRDFWCDWRLPDASPRPLYLKPLPPREAERQPLLENQPMRPRTPPAKKRTTTLVIPLRYCCCTAAAPFKLKASTPQPS